MPLETEKYNGWMETFLPMYGERTYQISPVHNERGSGYLHTHMYTLGKYLYLSMTAALTKLSIMQRRGALISASNWWVGESGRILGLLLVMLKF